MHAHHRHSGCCADTPVSQERCWSEGSIEGSWGQNSTSRKEPQPLCQESGLQPWLGLPSANRCWGLDEDQDIYLSLTPGPLQQMPDTLEPRAQWGILSGLSPAPHWYLAISRGSGCRSRGQPETQASKWPWVLGRATLPPRGCGFCSFPGSEAPRTTTTDGSKNSQVGLIMRPWWEGPGRLCCRDLGAKQVTGAVGSPWIRDIPCTSTRSETGNPHGVWVIHSRVWQRRARLGAGGNPAHTHRQAPCQNPPHTSFLFILPHGWF